MGVCETTDLALFLKYICICIYRQQERRMCVISCVSVLLCIYGMYVVRENGVHVFVYLQRGQEKRVRAYPHINGYCIHQAYVCVCTVRMFEQHAHPLIPHSIYTNVCVYIARENCL